MIGNILEHAKVARIRAEFGYLGRRAGNRADRDCPHHEPGHQRIQQRHRRAAARIACRDRAAVLRLDAARGCDERSQVVADLTRGGTKAGSMLHASSERTNRASASARGKTAWPTLRTHASSTRVASSTPIAECGTWRRGCSQKRTLTNASLPALEAVSATLAHTAISSPSPSIA